MSFTSEWEWRTQVALPPPSGKVGSDTGNWSAVLSLYFTTKDRFNVDQTAALAALAVGDTITIKNKNQADIWSTWTVSTAPVLVSGYYTVGVHSEQAQGTPQANSPMTVIFEPSVGPPPEPAKLYRILQNSDMVTFCASATELISQGFEPVGGLALPTIGSTPTFMQGFWRQEAVEHFVLDRVNRPSILNNP